MTCKYFSWSCAGEGSPSLCHSFDKHFDPLSVFMCNRQMKGNICGHVWWPQKIKQRLCAESMVVQLLLFLHLGCVCRLSFQIHWQVNTHCQRTNSEPCSWKGRRRSRAVSTLPGTKHFHTKGKVHISRLYKDIKDQPLWNQHILCFFTSTAFWAS